MSATGYQLLGRLVWHGGGWYVRRRYLSKLPSARKSAGVSIAVLALLAALIAIARRG
ncbi:MAG TPA: hypothetical protein VID48_03825 [Solirubrobacteraceae bacterium]|jgi:hypothetical protein